MKSFAVLILLGIIHLFYTHHKVLMDRIKFMEHEEISYLNISEPYSFKDCVSSKEQFVLARAAFLDNRPRQEYTNTTVILASIHRSLIGKDIFKACIVGNHEVTTINVQPLIANNWIHRIHPECTYNNTLIFCFDTPPCENGSRVELVYKDPLSHKYIRAETEYPLHIPQSTRVETPRTPSVIVCATVFGTPPYFKQWIRYQKKIGVDMVYLNAQESFVEDPAFNDSFLQESIHDGFVTIQVWKEYLGNKVFYHNQAMYYNNCLYKYQGVYDYAMMLDSDDFFYSASRTSPVSEVVQELFKEEKVGSVKLEWRRYYDPVPFGFELSDLDNFVNISGGMYLANVKSIHKLLVGIEIRVHAIVEMMDSCEVRDADSSVALVAHIKDPLLFNLTMQ